MPITPAQVDVWRGQPTETENLEFKEAKTQYDTEKLFGYCVAIANEGGRVFHIRNRESATTQCGWYGGIPRYNKNLRKNISNGKI